MYGFVLVRVVTGENPASRRVIVGSPDSLIGCDVTMGGAPSLLQNTDVVKHCFEKAVIAW